MMKLSNWVRWLGLSALALALVGLGLSLMSAATAQATAVALVILANRVGIAAAVLGVVLSWQRRRWVWLAALTLAGLVTLLSGPISDAVNTNAPYIIGPLIVGALALTLTGAPRLPRGVNASTR